MAASSFFRVVFYFPSLLSIVALALVFYFIVDVKGPIALEFNSIGLIIRRLSGAKVRLLHGLWFSAYGRASAIR